MASVFELTVEQAVANIRAREHDLCAYVSTRLDDALAEGRERRDEPRRSPLHGVPFGLKDEWETTSLPTTGGSYRHRARVPAANGAVVRTFEDAGAVLVGKTNLPDMGLPPEATSYVGGACKNPFDRERTAGGSSGGAAAAVAAGFQGFDWGTDIGGSIRLPAAFCGVLGMRLSNETWPMSEMFPAVPPALDWMCGQGPIVKTTDQMRAVLDVAAPKLRTGRSRSFGAKAAMLYAPQVVGEWPTFADDVLPHVRAAFEDEVERDTALPPTTHVRNVYSSLWASHFEELLASDTSIGLREGNRAVLSALLFRGRFGDRRFHPLTAQVLAMIAVGRFTLFRDRAAAMTNARAVRDAFEEAWDRGFVVVAPVCCFRPPRIGRSNRNPHLLSCTMPQNIADATCLAIPFGHFGSLPRAIQLVGPPGSENELLEIADRFIASRDAAS